MNGQNESVSALVPHLEKPRSLLAPAVEIRGESADFAANIRVLLEVLADFGDSEF